MYAVVPFTYPFHNFKLINREGLFRKRKQGAGLDFMKDSLFSGGVNKAKWVVKFRKIFNRIPSYNYLTECGGMSTKSFRPAWRILTNKGEKSTEKVIKCCK